MSRIDFFWPYLCLWKNLLYFREICQELIIWIILVNSNKFDSDLFIKWLIQILSQSASIWKKLFAYIIKNKMIILRKYWMNWKTNSCVIQQSKLKFHLSFIYICVYFDKYDGKQKQTWNEKKYIEEKNV